MLFVKIYRCIAIKTFAYRLTIELYRKIDYILYSYFLGVGYFPKKTHQQ